MTTANQSKVVLEEMKIWCKNKLRGMSLFIPWGVGGSEDFGCCTINLPDPPLAL